MEDTETDRHDRTGEASRLPRNPSLPKRRAARLVAVQALYQLELTGQPPQEALRDIKTLCLEAAPDDEAAAAGEVDAVLMGEVVRGAWGDARIDPLINRTLSGGWTVERLESVLRAILRAGTFEMLVRTDVPAHVVINEYVQVAKAFYDKTEPGLVNAVLDRLARELRPAERTGERRGDGGQKKSG